MMKKMLMVSALLGAVLVSSNILAAPRGGAIRPLKKGVIAFDFDLTFINGHTGGYPYGQDRVTQKLALTDLFNNSGLYKTALEALQAKGYKIVIVTRGIEEDVARALAHAGLNDIISREDVYGASRDDYSHGSEQEGRPQRIGINTPKEWEAKKVEYLKHIMDVESASLPKVVDKKAKVYFYDDTQENIVAARAAGFKNSYVVKTMKSDGVVGGGLSLLQELAENMTPDDNPVIKDPS
jgi:hypothetical protein